MRQALQATDRAARSAAAADRRARSAAIHAQHRASEASRRLETDPRHRRDRCDRDRGDRHRPEGLQDGARVRGLDRAGAAPELDRRQGAAGLASPSRATAICGACSSSARTPSFDTRALHPDKHPWVMRLLAKQAGQGGRRGARQQDGAHRLGDAGQGRRPIERRRSRQRA